MVSTYDFWKHFKVTLENFKGNILTKKERDYRLSGFHKEIISKDIDGELVPYLEKINTFPFIVTTQSCCGHFGNNHRRAHFDFRSMLGEADTINLLLRPVCDKFDATWVELMLEGDRLRYCLWLDNDKWRQQFKYFIYLLNANYVFLLYSARCARRKNKCIG